MNTKRKISEPVSVIIPMRNSETTIVKTLNGIFKQDYPITDIVIVDNVSSDNSIRIVKRYKNKRKIPITLILHKKNVGVGASYNEGVKASRSSLVIFMHSDSELLRKNEIKLLTEPFRNPSVKNVIATYSYILLPKKVWITYNFWQKCLLSYAVDKKMAGLNGKFDCLSKNAFLKIGGYNATDYGHHIGVGSEDADLHILLKKYGKVVKTNAEVVHLHYLKDDYSLKQWILNRKLLARSYGRLMRIQQKNLLELGPGLILFFVKPGLSLISFVPYVYPYWIFILFLFSFVYMKQMYMSATTLTNPKIILLPFITIFLIFYESFWMIESFLFLRASRV